MMPPGSRSRHRRAARCPYKCLKTLRYLELKKCHKRVAPERSTSLFLGK
jgi:hypothetical protein